MSVARSSAQPAAVHAAFVSTLPPGPPMANERRRRHEVSASDRQQSYPPMIHLRRLQIIRGLRVSRLTGLLGLMMMLYSPGTRTGLGGGGLLGLGLDLRRHDGLKDKKEKPFAEVMVSTKLRARAAYGGAPTAGGARRARRQASSFRRNQIWGLEELLPPAYRREIPMQN